jgi:hypothetical protein
MVNYQESKIYKIVSDQTDKIYIGSTTKKYLSTRMAMHRYVNSDQNKCSTSYRSGEILKYGDAKIILIENYDCKSKDELHEREQYWIDQNKEICVNQNNAHGPDMKKYKKWQNTVNNCLYCDKEVKYHSFTNHCKTKNHKDNVAYFKPILKNLN